MGLNTRITKGLNVFLVEVYREEIYRAAGLPTEYKEFSQSKSVKGVVRGLHFQWDLPMGKIIRVIVGTAFLVAIDIRKGYSTLGQ